MFSASPRSCDVTNYRFESSGHRTGRSGLRRLFVEPTPSVHLNHEPLRPRGTIGCAQVPLIGSDDDSLGESGSLCSELVGVSVEPRGSTPPHLFAGEDAINARPSA